MEISTSIVTRDLLVYLSSYSGIEKLTFQRVHMLSQIESDRLADDIFCTVLPRHANTLIELSGTAEYESGWGFESHNVDAISDLHKLAHLEMNVNAEDVVEVQPSMNAVNYRSSTRAPEPYYLHEKSENTQGSVFDIRSMKHSKDMEEGITIAVQNFCSHSETPVIVRAVNDLYQLTPVGLKNGMNPFSAIAIALEFDLPRHLIAPMLLDISVELLHEIGTQLGSLDHKNLRRVCKDLSVSMEPLVFSYLCLKVNELHLEGGLQILETLATGETGWSRYVKTLKIRRNQEIEQDVGGAVGVNRSNSRMQKLLASAVGSMINVQTVIWNVDERDPTWELSAICDFLNTLPLLDDFQLEVESIVDLSLVRLSGLRNLKIRTPYWKPAPIVQQVLQIIPKCPDLHSLELTGSSAWSEVWTMLRAVPESEIRLKNISTNIVTFDLLSYLASYSGVEKLTFDRPDGGSDDEANRLANMFFGTVLPRHVTSLVEMSCPSLYETHWSFGMHNVDAVLALHKVTSLKMTVNYEDVVNMQASMKSVNLLLRTATLLPALCRLLILSASVRSDNGWCGTGRASHADAVNRGIMTAIQNFNASAASPVNVHTWYVVYELKPVKLDENNTAAAVEDPLWKYCTILHSKGARFP
ncbi:hypothetical protein C8R44DRAFT_881055 [Mycena epipterygia]|nr:hypothetical protein C8R44DRAFT_881055 [Mycena epipterygia]